MTGLYIIIGLIILAVLAAKLYLAAAGIEDIRVDASAPVVLEAKDSESISLSKELKFWNEGKQCATIMDAICRSQLPYEQYDGIEVRAKAERDGEIREDDYFEAVIIQKKGYVRNEDHLNVYAKVKLLPRKGLSLNEALSHMVDLPLDFIWQETGRTPWHYRKLRLVITAEEIAKLAGVELVKD